MSQVFDTIDDVQRMASLHDAVLVACSFGKDSLVVMDLCAKYFKRVEAFCMAFVPGLSVVTSWQQYARDRWGIEVKEIQHWVSARQIAQGYRCFAQGYDGKLPSLASTLESQKKEYGIALSATGTRAAESLGRKAGLQRRQRGEEKGAWPGDWHPIAWWRRHEVLSYVSNNNIPLPEGAKDMQGWSNESGSILKLHDEYPEDYHRWLEVFPLASCVVTRRELYGIT